MYKITLGVYAAKNTHYMKNLWRRKCVRREIFRNDFICNTSNCVTVRPVRGHLTPKMNIAFSIRNLMLNISYSTIFSKKTVFSQKPAKNCFGGAFDNFFRERRRLMPKINITFFITNEVSNILLFTNFFQKCVIF